MLLKGVVPSKVDQKLATAHRNALKQKSKASKVAKQTPTKKAKPTATKVASKGAPRAKKKKK